MARASNRYLVIASAAVAISLLLPTTLALLMLQGIALSGCVATLVGIRRGTPQGKHWYLLLAGASSFLVGTLVREAHGALIGEPSPFPSPADALYYAGYLSLISAFLVLIRSRRARREPANLVDALIMGAGLGMVIWSFVMTAYSAQGDMPLVARVMAGAYSVLDLILLGVLSRVAVGSGERNRSYYLLVATMVLLVAADLLATMATQTPWLGPLALVCSTLCFVTGGAASLHPSMKRLDRRAAPSVPVLTRGRLAVLFCALALGPLALAAARALGHSVNMATVIVGVSVLSTLVLARMAVLVRANEARIRREGALRRASESMIASTTREQMLAGVTIAVSELGLAVPGRGVVGLHSRIVQLDSGGLVIDTSSASLHGRHATELLSSEAQGALSSRHTTVLGADPWTEPDADASPSATGWVVCPLVSQNAVRGALIVSAASPMSPELVEGLTGLTAELALALETAALVEDQHRRHSERRFQALIENSSDIILIVDADRVITYASPGVAHVLGYSSEQVLGFSLDAFLPAEEVPALASALQASAARHARHELVEIRVIDAAGAWHVLEATANDLRHDPDVGGIVLNARDATDRKTLENELRHQALHDTLTGLSNRALFTDRVGHALSRRTEGSVAVLLIDLDDFKTVNDSMGHAAGDQLLVAVADRLRTSLRTSDTPSRFGGDEFVVLLDDSQTDAQVDDVADRVLSALHAPFSLNGREVSITASMGVAVDPSRSTTAEVLVRNADAAMHLAKQRGKGRRESYHEDMHLLALERLELRSDLARAVEREELVLHFQPIVDMQTGRTKSLEALVRWNHSTRGVVPPLQFIPLAEETGLIVPMGAWILESACRQVRSLEGRGWDDVMLTVNVSVRQLQTDRLVEDVLRALRLSELPAQRLAIEITESILLADTDEIRDRLDDLRSHGVKVAIDDFGSGYSSLGYLQRFPVDILKLDRSFVEDMTAHPERQGVVRAVVDLAQSMNLRLVAEGIETVDQRDALQTCGCRYGQGYLWSRPVPLGELVEPHEATTPQEGASRSSVS